MKASKHTPGPWSSSAWGESSQNIIVSRDATGNEIPIAVVLDTGLAPEVVEANQRMVKALPLLWDACIAALGYLGGEGDDNPKPARAAVYRAVKEGAGLSHVGDGELWDYVNPDSEGSEGGDE